MALNAGQTPFIVWRRLLALLVFVSIPFALAAIGLSQQPPRPTRRPPRDGQSTIRAGRERKPLNVLLSRTGGDRGTAYVMSNKIARRGGDFVVTWIDVNRQNWWAIVDEETDEILRRGTVGPVRKDNHCGAAIATDLDGTLHLIVGGHQGSFIHYRLPPHSDAWAIVEDGRKLGAGASATYPSLVCDRDGTLHLTFRGEPGGHDAVLRYCRRPRDGQWSEPKTLARNSVREHSWLTNAIEVGPKGRLHVVMSNTLAYPKLKPRGRYYGASHLYSDDSGETWRQFSVSAPLPGAVSASELERIEGEEFDPARIEADYRGAPGPLNPYYHKILLSNPVVDDEGRPWVIVHNLLQGDAQLFGHLEGEGWRGHSLKGAVSSLLPGFRIQHCGQLSRDASGKLIAVLMVAPETELGWGAKGTRLVWLTFSPDGSFHEVRHVRQPARDRPDWLPIFERWSPHAPIESPALIFTRGINAGGYSNNRNQVETEIWLQAP